MRELILAGLANGHGDQGAMLSALAEQMENLEERIMAVLKATKEKAPPRILQSAEELKQLKEQLTAVEMMMTKTARTAAKAQFLASMSVGFCADTAKLIVSGRTPEAGEKTEFLAQTDAWAEGFAEKYLQD